MLRTARKVLTGTDRSRGFTLVELLIVILIVGILAAVAVPLYLGYTQDARSAEGKALAGSTLTALQGCVQARGAGGTCTRAEITNRVGVDTAGLTGDGRWTVSTASLTVSTTSPPTFAGTIEISGQAGKDTNNIGIGMYVSTTGVTMRCTTTTTTAPGSAGGDPC
jgi:prepilin-type N-terminal cleavage/methylation domain-containing protein